jgi:hypothetical protein
MEAGGPRPSRRWGIATVLAGALVVLVGAGGIGREVEPDRTIHEGNVIKKTAIFVHQGTTTEPRVTNAKVKIGLLDTNETRTVSFEGLAGSLPEPSLGTPVDVETEGKDGAVTRVRYQGTWYGGETDAGRFTGPALIVLAGLVLAGVGVRRLWRARWASAAAHYRSG